MKNIIAFSLWGDNPMYWVGALRNIELAKEYYPGWICRFYIDEESRTDLIESIKGDNVEVILVSSKDSFHGMFWRFWASIDDDVDIFISRDCDSRITEREVCAVNEWLESDKDFHIMRDHPYHQVPILSGMWGSKNNSLSNINDLLNEWEIFPNKGRYNAEDQDFLGQLIYPIMNGKTLEHSEFGINYGQPIYNFSKNREDYEFVGDVFDQNENRHPDFWKIIK